MILLYFSVFIGPLYNYKTVIIVHFTTTGTSSSVLLNILHYKDWTYQDWTYQDISICGPTQTILEYLL